MLVWSNYRVQPDHLSEMDSEIEPEISCLRSIHNRANDLDDLEIRNLWIQMT